MKTALLVVVSAFLAVASLFPAETVKTDDGLLVATLPSGWTQTPDKKFLMIQNTTDNAFATLSAEDRRDQIGLTLEKFTFAKTYQLLEDLTFVNVSGPKKITVSGNPAIQYEVTGVSGTIKIMYLITCIEAKNTTQTIVGWTSASMFEKMRTQLEMIPKAVQEGSIK